MTLHIGPGTFQPVQVEDVAEHQMQGEWCELPAATAEAINACKARGRRVVAVGSTCGARAGDRGPAGYAADGLVG